MFGDQVLLNDLPPPFVVVLNDTFDSSALALIAAQFSLRDDTLKCISTMLNAYSSVYSLLSGGPDMKHKRPKLDDEICLSFRSSSSLAPSRACLAPQQQDQCSQLRWSK
jgi:hypothetical protein